MKFKSKLNNCHASIFIWKCRLQNVGHFLSVSIKFPVILLGWGVCLECLFIKWLVVNLISCSGATKMQRYMLLQWVHFCSSTWVNTLRPRQNGHRFPDDIFKCIFLDENVWIPIKISLKFVPQGPINNIPALVQIMAWRRPGDKPLSEPMMVRLPTHTCVTRPQWVNVSDTKCHRIRDPCVRGRAGAGAGAAVRLFTRKKWQLENWHEATSMEIDTWLNQLTVWGRMTHKCVNKLTSNGSDNVLSPDRRQAIIWTNAGILLAWTLRRNFSEI